METSVENTFKEVCDMCTAGHLQHPNSFGFLKKRTQILTTSELVWRTVQRSQCVGEHHHDQVAGSCKPFGHDRMPVTKFSELYTAVFGNCIGRAIVCSCRIDEKVFGQRIICFRVRACTWAPWSQATTLVREVPSWTAVCTSADREHGSQFQLNQFKPCRSKPSFSFRTFEDGWTVCTPSR